MWGSFFVCRLSKECRTVGSKGMDSTVIVRDGKAFGWHGQLVLRFILILLATGGKAKWNRSFVTNIFNSLVHFRVRVLPQFEYAYAWKFIGWIQRAHSSRRRWWWRRRWGLSHNLFSLGFFHYKSWALLPLGDWWKVLCENITLAFSFTGTTVFILVML